jgi:hypothetical protein
MMSSGQRFFAVTDESLACMIRNATRRVVFVAPAPGKATAGALLAVASRENGAPAVDIILDADAETCRIGYGDSQALALLQDRMADFQPPMRRQRGVRIGLLIVDEQLVIWSPTPKAVEADREPDQPNGIVLSASAVDEVEAAVVVDPRQPGSPQPEIGKEPLAEEDLAKTVAELEHNPPVPFDLARRTRVFASRFQFVETELRGAEWTQRRVKVSSILLNADLPESLQDVLETHVRPFQSKADLALDVPLIIRGERAFKSDGTRILGPLKQSDVLKSWNDIQDRYLWQVKGFGWLIRSDRLNSFQAEAEAYEETLRAWVTAFREHVALDEDALVNDITAAVKGRVGRRPTRNDVDESDLKARIAQGLERIRVIEPKVKIVIKNVSWESTRDAEFEEALRTAVPAPELDGWFQEFTAAKQRVEGARG